MSIRFEMSNGSLKVTASNGVITKDLTNHISSMSRDGACTKFVAH